MDKTKTLPSGRKLLLQIADFDTSYALFEVAMSELRQVKLGDSIKLAAGMDVQKLLQQDLPIDGLKDLFCTAVSSRSIRSALGECFKGCQYNGEAINDQTFQDEDARGDYLPAAWEVMSLNLAPFFKGLASKLSAIKPPG